MDGIISYLTSGLRQPSTSGVLDPLPGVDHGVRWLKGITTMVNDKGYR